MTHARLPHLALSIVLLATSAASGASVADRIDVFAREALERASMPPGLAIAVVKDDRIVYRGAFGFRDVEAKLAVTPDTLFYVGSSTKAFTAMMALALAAEKVIDLDAPITTWWPELKLTPVDATRISLRDLLAMRPGFFNATYNYRSTRGNITTEAELLRILATYTTVQPRVFQYSNMSFELAAEVIGRATGRTYRQLTRERVFEPLAMTSSTSEVPPAGADVAHLYRSPARGVFLRNRDKVQATMGPAGGTYMRSADAAGWLIAMMNDGRLGGRQALPARAVRAAQSFQTTNSARFHDFDRWGWGLGEDLGEYEGDLLVHRFGGFNGAFSHLSFMPDRKVGVAVFSNGGSAVADAIAAFAYDAMLGKPDLDAKWKGKLEALAADADAARERVRSAEAAAHPGAAPGRAASAYAGTYVSERLGTIVVSAAEGALRAQFGAVPSSELLPAGGDAFSVDWDGGGEYASVRFVFEGDTPLRLEWGERIFVRAR